MGLLLYPRLLSANTGVDIRHELHQLNKGATVQLGGV